jgi:hypothetical protein
MERRNLRKSSSEEESLSLVSSGSKSCASSLTIDGSWFKEIRAHKLRIVAFVSRCHETKLKVILILSRFNFLSFYLASFYLALSVFSFEWSSLLMLISWYFIAFLFCSDDFSQRVFVWVTISIINPFLACLMLISWFLCDIFGSVWMIIFF